MVSPASVLGQLFEFAPGYIAMVRGPDHVFEVANAAYRNLLGNCPIIGLPVCEVVPELVEQGYIDLLDQVYRSGEPYMAEGAPVLVREQLRYISFVYQPIKDRSGKVTGIFAEGVDVTEATQAQQALRRTERRLESVLNNASVSIFLMDERQHCTYMNRAAEQLTGYTFEEVQRIDKPLHDIIHHTYPNGRPFPLSECAIDRAFPEHNQMQGEEIFVHKDGHFYPVAFTASPIRDEASQTVGTIIEVLDISEQKEAQQRQRLLLNELNHRVKNTLAMVQAIAYQTFKQGREPADTRETFEGRIAALASAHDLLTGRGWSAAPLREVIHKSLAGLAGKGQLDLDGPEIMLPPETAVSISIAIHELATNALKYGSLSVPEGVVNIRWSDAAGRFTLKWQECHGPPVGAAGPRGFGLRLIEQGLSRELDGRVELDFSKDGLVCTVDAPLPLVK